MSKELKMEVFASKEPVKSVRLHVYEFHTSELYENKYRLIRSAAWKIRNVNACGVFEDGSYIYTTEKISEEIPNVNFRLTYLGEQELGVLEHKKVYSELIKHSATPHDGRAKSFASLMNMLDPTAIADPENYTKEDIEGLCIRRFKKDVKDQVSGSFLERNITLERCHASVREEQSYDIFADMQLEMDLGKSRGTGQLFKTSLEKSLFSSPAACIKSIDARLKKLYRKYSTDDIKDIKLLEELRDSLLKITPKDFMRYQKLLYLLNSKEYAWNPKDTGDRVVIFTERIETMKYLAEHLHITEETLPPVQLRLCSTLLHRN